MASNHKYEYTISKLQVNKDDTTLEEGALSVDNVNGTSNTFYTLLQTALDDNKRSITFNGIKNQEFEVKCVDNATIRSSYNTAGSISMKLNVPVAEQNETVFPNYLYLIANSGLSATSSIIMKILTQFIISDDMLTYYYWSDKLKSVNNVPNINIYDIITKEPINLATDDTHGMPYDNILQQFAKDHEVLNDFPLLMFWNAGRQGWEDVDKDTNVPNFQEICNSYARDFNKLIDYIITNDITVVDDNFIDNYLTPLFGKVSKRQRQINNDVDGNMISSDSYVIYSHANGTLMLPSLVNYIADKTNKSQHALSYCGYVPKNSLLYVSESSTVDEIEPEDKLIAAEDSDLTGEQAFVYPNSHAEFNINGGLNNIGTYNYPLSGNDMAKMPNNVETISRIDQVLLSDDVFKDIGADKTRFPKETRSIMVKSRSGDSTSQFADTQLNGVERYACYEDVIMNNIIGYTYFGHITDTQPSEDIWVKEFRTTTIYVPIYYYLSLESDANYYSGMSVFTYGEGDDTNSDFPSANTYSCRHGFLKLGKYKDKRHWNSGGVHSPSSISCMRINNVIQNDKKDQFYTFLKKQIYYSSQCSDINDHNKKGYLSIDNDGESESIKWDSLPELPAFNIGGFYKKGNDSPNNIGYILNVNDGITFYGNYGANNENDMNCKCGCKEWGFPSLQEGTNQISSASGEGSSGDRSRLLNNNNFVWIGDNWLTGQIADASNDFDLMNKITDFGTADVLNKDDTGNDGDVHGVNWIKNNYYYAVFNNSIQYQIRYKKTIESVKDTGVEWTKVQGSYGRSVDESKDTSIAVWTTNNFMDTTKDEGQLRRKGALMTIRKTTRDVYLFNENVFDYWLSVVRSHHGAQLILNDIRKFLKEHLDVILLNKACRILKPIITTYFPNDEAYGDRAFVNIPFGPPLVYVPKTTLIDEKFHYASYVMNNNDKYNTYKSTAGNVNIINSIIYKYIDPKDVDYQKKDKAEKFRFRGFMKERYDPTNDSTNDKSTKLTKTTNDKSTKSIKSTKASKGTNKTNTDSTTNDSTADSTADSTNDSTADSTTNDSTSTDVKNDPKAKEKAEKDKKSHKETPNNYLDLLLSEMIRNCEVDGVLDDDTYFTILIPASGLSVLDILSDTIAGLIQCTATISVGNWKNPDDCAYKKEFPKILLTFRPLNDSSDKVIAGLRSNYHYIDAVSVPYITLHKEQGAAYVQVRMEMNTNAPTLQETTNGEEQPADEPPDLKEVQDKAKGKDDTNDDDSEDKSTKDKKSNDKKSNTDKSTKDKKSNDKKSNDKKSTKDKKSNTDKSTNDKKSESFWFHRFIKEGYDDSNPDPSTTNNSNGNTGDQSTDTGDQSTDTDTGSSNNDNSSSSANVDTSDQGSDQDPSSTTTGDQTTNDKDKNNDKPKTTTAGFIGKGTCPTNNVLYIYVSYDNNQDYLAFKKGDASSTSNDPTMRNIVNGRSNPMAVISYRGLDSMFPANCLGIRELD